MNGEEREWAALIQDCRREFVTRGETAITAVMDGAAPGSPGIAVPWRRYPEGEVYDPASHAQYFYHCHPAEAAQRPPGQGDGPIPSAEHGHFHLFLRAEGMPRGVSPLLFPEQAVANAPVPAQAAPLTRGGSDRVAHLVAVAVDRRGEPIRLFTTNRWVTGETWYRGTDLARMLDRFVLRGDGPTALLDRWLSALVGLYRADIERLLERRDEAVAKWRWLWPRRGSATEDTRLEVTSHIAIDLDERLATLGRVAAMRHSASPQRQSSGLSRLAEGWGS